MGERGSDEHVRRQRNFRHPVLTSLMLIFGLILLAPGVCAAFFVVGMGVGNGDFDLAGLWAICFLISAGGIWLLIRVFR